VSVWISVKVSKHITFRLDGTSWTRHEWDLKLHWHTHWHVLTVFTTIIIIIIIIICVNNNNNKQKNNNNNSSSNNNNNGFVQRLYTIKITAIYQLCACARQLAGSWLPDRVSCEKSFSMYVAGALKNSLKSSAVGGGESMSKLYGLRTHDDDLGLSADDSGVLLSALYLHEHRQLHQARRRRRLENQVERKGQVFFAQ